MALSGELKGLIKYVIQLNLDHKKNAKQIYELLKKNNSDPSISQPATNKFSPSPIATARVNHVLDIMRYIIAHYMKDCYYLEKIADLNEHASISIDENLFVHQGNKQIWVAGLINNTSRKIRLEILPNRNAETIKKIITNLVPTGYKIVTDGAIFIIG